MSYKKIVVTLILAALALSSCKMPAPQSDVTPNPTSSIDKPIATNAMFEVERAATQTAFAKTGATQGGPTATPGAPVAGGTSTPNIGGPSATPTVGLPGGNLIPTLTPTVGSPAGGPTATIAVVTGRPATYTLMEGEFPFCIARRFNVDPSQLLQLSGLSDGVMYPAGTVLQIPQSGSFPGDRALRQHPTTYTVTSAGETFYSIACLFGDVQPSQIAQANGIALGTPLTLGQAIKIP
ncbi:MAG: LysM peptidoglycan-binding domain-containing protein [Chloroflexi bacterium]|nr:LysM peptidoglycan-binding domain-containing protein [Chloroflexota bacterium]